ncbi:MAG: radical SAM protein, partial [Promethearchaeota archaeon]
PKVSTHPNVEILTITEGCKGNCTYCCTKIARDYFYSFPFDEIQTQFKDALRGGKTIFWVTAQDCSNYSHDEMDLVDLVSALTEEKGIFYLRIGMLNPRYFVENVKRMVRLLGEAKVFQFLHIPIQSGSNGVLEKMARQYTIEPVLKALGRLKSQIPQCTISTDVICGFPTESDDDFQKTIDVIKKIEPDVLNISQFSSRTGTEAKKFPQLLGKIKKERSRILSNIFHEIKEKKIREKWQTWDGEVIVERMVKPGEYLCRNFAYTPIFVKGMGLSGKIRVVTNIKNLRVSGKPVR